MITACNSIGDNQTDSQIEHHPFSEASTLPFQAIDFDKVRDTDFKPAFEQALLEHNREIEKIANDTTTPGFENTLVALEKSGAMLGRVERAFDLLTGANTNDILQQVEEEMAPRLAAHNDGIYLNEKLFKRVDAVYKQLDTLELDAESRKLVDYYHRKFIMAGAALSETDKQQLKELNEEAAALSSRFSNQLLAASKAAALTVDSKEALKGLSEAAIAAAAAAAKADKQEGKYQLVIINTTQQPALQSLQNRQTRETLFEHAWTRAEKSDSNDTRAGIARLAQIRARKAELLGYPNFAAWTLQNQMAKTPEAVTAFLNKLVPAAVQKAAAEAEVIQSAIIAEKDSFQLEPWDWDYYAEKVRLQRYQLDDAAIKPYFVLDSVLKNGVFFAAEKLYGISFKPRTDLPVYHKDVRVFEVIDTNGHSIGLFYGDFYKRDNKRGGAWMSNMVVQSRLLGTKPVIYNVCNFPKPVAGQPALISFDDVTTMFHEFGHALHGLFANQQYPSLSGTDVARDFVEMPSQFNEHWALDTTVLKNYARHYETGQPMPDSLITKIKAASGFNQGYAFTELLAATNLDLQWHLLTSRDSIVRDVDAFEKAALERTGLLIAAVPPRYRSSYFQHIWANGYAAGYYAYTWADMLNHDAFAWFTENGGLTRANGQRFREMILSRGNSEDLATLYRNFRMKEPDIKYMLHNKGLQ
ncbi:peptidyl-dipeptidase Dcp [Niabella terrae]